MNLKCSLLNFPKMGFALRVRNFWLFLGIFSITKATDNIGFLFTAPKTFLSGYDENVCLTFRNLSEAVKINVTIFENKEDNIITSVIQEITPKDYGGKCFKILIPKTKIKNGRLQLTIHSKTEEDFKINYIEQIFIQRNPDMTFIQMDKPVYNSGHIIRFRIFTLRSDLTPVLEPVERIWIENPNGIHLVQWLNESPDQGFITKTFQLSKEPFPGKWFIKVKRKNNDVVSQSFLVENYILPKFSVIIRTPDYIDLSAKNITVCAKYVFGEPVHGDLILQYFVKCSFSYYCQETGSSVTQNLRLNVEGCTNHEISLNNISSFAQSLILNATVIEDGTQIKEKAFSKIEIRNTKRINQLEFSDDTKQRKFKPGLPFKGQVVIKGQTEIDQKVLVCLGVNEEKSCKELLVRKNSADFYILPVQIKNENKFKAFLEIENLRKTTQPKPIIKLNLVPWYSPSGTYMQLEETTREPLRCEERAKINVLYTSPDPSSLLQFHYMIKARGDILAKGVLSQFSLASKPLENFRNINIINRGDIENVKQFAFFVDVTPLMSPRSYLIVYFIRSDGEVVADSLNLKVKKCLPNKVFTSWNKTLSTPGSKNNFYIKTSPNSLCALTVTDKSTKLVGNSELFNEEKIFSKVEKFEVRSQTFDRSANRCKDNFDVQIKTEKDSIEPLTYPHESDSRFVDSLEAFNNFGALVITDLNLETRPCKEKNEETKTNSTTRNSKINAFGNEIENISVFNAEEFFNEHHSNAREFPLSYELRSFFPETWIWDLIFINNSGIAELNFKLPHTLTEWASETVCLSLTKGLGISESSKLVTYQPFFLDFAVPHSLKRKEIFHLHVSVFNYESTDLPVKITLSPSNSFISRSEESSSYCIRTKSKGVHRFVLESVKLGEAEIKVKAEIDTSFSGDCGNVKSGRSDIVVKKTVIKHEGFPMEEVKSGFICGNVSNFDHQVVWNMKIPPDVVESSITVKALVSGDILGPSLLNVEHLITLPTGCGEQNMILLVPNVLLLDYLLLTKSEELQPIERALKNLDLGYQRQLNYKHCDGSYSAFGEQDEKGSIWLTAFVVRYLSQAKKYIYIDESDLNASVAWIMKHQLENGCFPLIGKIYHRELQEKLVGEDSSKTLTAYILISLLEAGISLENPVVKNAIYCLKPTEESLGIYGDLLSAYALILAGEYRDSQALMLDLMKEAKRSYGMLWWENEESIESFIEMTSYGILTLVKLGGPLFMAAASDAIRWIIQYQNQNGGFISSQDTVLALEAISKFSATLPRTSEHDKLFIKLHVLEETLIFNISNTNRLLQQEATLPTYLADVHFESTGKGCALVQTWVKYNIRRAKPNENFKVQLRIHSVSDVDLYSVARFHICVRYKSPKDKISMAILEVSMVSGYFPDRSSLYEIRTSRKGVRRWEEFEDKINFYFEDLRNKKVCVNFVVVQEVCIENAAPALIKLYDYYNTNHHTTLKYNLMRECQNSVWPETVSSQIKQESKRDIKFQDDNQRNNFYTNNFRDFVDLDQDLETPEENVFPVFALPPRGESGEQKYYMVNRIKAAYRFQPSPYFVFSHANALVAEPALLNKTAEFIVVGETVEKFQKWKTFIQRCKKNALLLRHFYIKNLWILGQHCPHCLTKIPGVFSKLYCSSEIAIKIQILSRETLEFYMDISPRKNFTSLKRTVSFTIREGCACHTLDSVNGFALLLVTPPRTFRVHYLHELHIDESIQLYPWGDPNEMPNYLRKAINYCQRRSLGIDY